MVTSPVTASNQQTAELLAQQGVLPEQVLKGLLSRAETLQEWLGQVAVDDGLVSPQELAVALSRKLAISLVNLDEVQPHPMALDQLAADTCRSFCVLPLEYDGAKLTIAMANPLDEAAKATIHALSGCEVVARIAPMAVVLSTIDRWYGTLPSAARPGADAGRDDDSAPRVKAPGDSMPPRVDSLNTGSELTIDQLLYTMMEHRASDLHMAVGSPPMMRVDGELQAMPFPMLMPAIVQAMIYAILNDVQITTFERHMELDFAYSLPGVSRFRVNVLRQRGSVGAVMRTIPEDMPSLDKLKMPPIVREFTKRPRGLVLVTGPTGSGKSTTLAAMIDEINRTRHAHVVTIEDPIEFLHRNNQCVITQREVGADTESFAIALRHVLRQDPDVILIGEMRDLETISAAVTAAETGHLVFATLHTTSAAQTIDRIIDVFPPHQQEQIRSQLSNTLEGILTQTLLPNIDGHGRSCAMEIMVASPAIRNLIREGKVHQMPSVIQASGKYGMQMLDQALKQLVLARKVSLEEAIKKSSNPEDFKALVAMQ